MTLCSWKVTVHKLSLIWACINSQLDYCNGLVAELHASQMARLESLLLVLPG